VRRHGLEPRTRAIYSHVTPAMEQAITDALHRRWQTTHPGSSTASRPTLTIVNRHCDAA
jgi:hypothetical protein